MSKAATPAGAVGALAQAPAVREAGLESVLKIAIMAVGGQGGGVLTGWIEAVARANGYHCQATSVAGVAQRTGATIYYIEMSPDDGGPVPVFALAPAGGDVDVLVAAELMEAGRAILRGFVTPDRTTLIASTHRALAVSEKIVPGDGIAKAEAVIEAARQAARRLIAFDMERIAVEAGSVISASLLGAIAAAGVLPFPRSAFEEVIRSGGRGVEASLAAFAAAFERAERGAAEALEPDAAASTAAASPPPTPARPQGPRRLVAGWQALAAEVEALPAAVAEMARPGLAKVVDFMDLAYGREYLDRLARVMDRDDAEQGWALSREAAKYIANAMAYDDVIRVADLKTRGGRLRRIEEEMRLGDGQLLHLTEYLHPRAEEIVGMLPAGMGARWAADPARMRLIDRLFGRGRRLRSDGMTGFFALWLIGGLRRWRRRTHRHAVEMAHLEEWLSRALAALPDYALAVEVIRCRRLIKGYSDTHERGLSKFDRVLSGLALLHGRDDAADWIRRLREAALADEEGRALDGALATIRSFADVARPLPE
ncbi:MAG: indolepyruvate oxidoreductase subunit beta family protein [Alphaproteobacteria bacterium]|nr:MAG: indolepyruvate oxidoreductase subunit beta family protein [Alphaproteobacteria bacterium]